jgi:hypothetical protein
MRLIKTYSQDFIGKAIRKQEEKKLFAMGYKIESEEEVKEFNGGEACCLAIIFLPLVFFARSKKIKVVYEKK